MNDRLKALYGTHAARGMLQSGATIKLAIAAMEEEASKQITVCVDRVKAVAMDMEAFVMIQECVETSMTFLGKKLEGIVTMASGVNRSGQSSDGIGKAAEALFTDSRNQLRRQLEIHRFTFTVPRKPRTTVNLPDTVTTKPRGGKPLAAHWDEMWATIAVALFTGDLQPKTQADIERAMKDWLASNNVDAGDTAVR
ncbi:MAG TPA: hypothetical protein VGA46_05645, partial [Methyloceanibacter sp.]